ncbi:hypothetical protein GCM10011418_25310 [Sphingobacterium alkalisoli]|nr:hypothetical protein GCM10011418_25310 [Sphingobacterium alkalisoli]
MIPDDLESLQKLLDATQFMNMGICSDGEVASSDYFLQQATYNAFRDEVKLAYVWDNYDQLFNNDWAKAYSVVYTSNLVLDKLKRIERTADNSIQWDQIYAEALVFRANQYLSLVWTFAKAYEKQTASTDMGIVIRQSSDFNAKSERASLQECYRVIVDDLKKAADLLPTTSSYPTRPDKAGAHGSLARTFLSMREYEQALYHADRLLAIKDELLDYNSTSEVNMSANFPFLLFNKETVSYYELTSNTQISVTNAMVDTLLYETYEEADLRRGSFFKKGPKTYHTFRGTYSGSAKLFAGMTVAEAYLIKAECLVRLEQPDLAMNIMDKLLRHRYQTGKYVSPDLSSPEEILAFVLQERRKELLFRGLRWIDIKRLNLEGAEIDLRRNLDGAEFVLPHNSDRFALPLPADIILQTGMPQNPK